MSILTLLYWKDVVKCWKMVSNIFLSLARVSLFCSLITFQRRYSFQSQGSRGCRVCGSMTSAHRLLERAKKSSHYHASIPTLHLGHMEKVRQQKTSAGITQELQRVCVHAPHVGPLRYSPLLPRCCLLNWGTTHWQVNTLHWDLSAVLPAFDVNLMVSQGKKSFDQWDPYGIFFFPIEGHKG